MTYGWAGNQGCDRMHRFDGEAMVAVAVTGESAVWSAVVAEDPDVQAEFLAILHAT